MYDRERLFTIGAARETFRNVSKSERRLWFALAFVVAAVYSTLGLQRALAEVLRETGLLAPLFIISFAAVIAAVPLIATRFRLGGLQVGVILGVLVAYVMVFVRMGISEERTHLIEYGVIGALAYAAFRERSVRVENSLPPAIVALALTTLIGLADECIQWVLPSRVFDWRDVFFNFLAGTTAILASSAIDWAGRSRKTHSRGK